MYVPTANLDYMCISIVIININLKTFFVCIKFTVELTPIKNIQIRNYNLMVLKTNTRNITGYDYKLTIVLQY